MRQMGPDGLYVLGILAVIDGYFNCPAVRVEAKMMSGLVMRESHGLISVFFHLRLMLRSLFHTLLVHGARLHVLCYELQPAEQKKCDHCFHDLRSEERRVGKECRSRW